MFCSLDALKKASKKKQTEQRSKQSRCYNKLVTLERDQADEILGLDRVFGGFNNTDFMSSFDITSCFQKINFQAFNLVILNFETLSCHLHSCMRYVSY